MDMFSPSIDIDIDAEATGSGNGYLTCSLSPFWETPRRAQGSFIDHVQAVICSKMFFCPELSA